jgi:phosphoribosylaminoimidazolecarboxamide formyltransferase/IMP cyclohydrolase
MVISLKYGCNPHQGNAFAEPQAPSSPLEILNGNPSYINMLDALNSWQLVLEASLATGSVCAASFKHVSPAGASLAAPIDRTTASQYGLHSGDLSPTLSAYARARNADPKSSYGDFISISENVDLGTAEYIRTCISDGIVAPSYDADALAVLSQKKRGAYLVVRIDPAFRPPRRESRDVFGIRLVQDRSEVMVNEGDIDQVVSDGYIPFADNVELAAKHGIRVIVAPCGSVRDDDVRSACRDHGVTLVYTKRRYFHH